MSEQVSELIEPQTQKTTLSTKEVIAYLCEKFPLCFIAEGEAKPLKIGIFQVLAEALSDDEKVSKTLLRQALRTYTLGWRYLHACREGAVRVGLFGEEAGLVDAQQAEHAAKSLAESKAAFAERKAQALKEKRKEERKTFFKQKAREENAKKHAEKIQKKPLDGKLEMKASLESLAALENKFPKGKK